MTDTNPTTKPTVQEADVAALIERVRELDTAATPGPWHVGDGTLRDHYLGDSTLLCAGQEPLLPDSNRVLANLNPHYPCAADANLIAEYRTLALSLASALERAQADTARLDWMERHMLTEPLSDMVVERWGRALRNTICPPNNHGGTDGKWLFVVDDDRLTRFETEADTLRAAIDAAISTREPNAP